MEDSFESTLELISSQREGRGPKAKGGVTPDDLTNLNWVAGIPVPMNTSVSPPEGSRIKRLFFGSPSASDLLQEIGSPSTPTFTVPPRTKSQKTPLPTYKIVLKDQSHHTCSFGPSSPEKRDSVILANIVSSGNGYHEIPELEEPDKILIEDECCMDFEKQGGSTKMLVCSEETGNLQHKPNCSYTCLIGMALKASNGSLPVNAIYQYIE